MSWIWSLLGMSESQPGNTSHWPKCFKHQAANWCIMLCIYIYISHGCIFSTVFYFPFIIANVQNNGVFDSFFRWSVYFLSFISQHKETQKSTCKPSIRDDTPFQTKKRGRPAPRKNIAPASYSFWSPPGQSQGGCKPSATSLAFKALGRISAGQVG